jgi:hypothetical protein
MVEVAIGGRKRFTAVAASKETEEPRERRFAWWPSPFIGLPELLLLVDIDRGRFSDEWSSGKCGSECEWCKFFVSVGACEWSTQSADAECEWEDGIDKLRGGGE